jgi:hypothetical protein
LRTSEGLTQLLDRRAIRIDRHVTFWPVLENFAGSGSDARSKFHDIVPVVDHELGKHPTSQSQAAWAQDALSEPGKHPMTWHPIE